MTQKSSPGPTTAPSPADRPGDDLGDSLAPLPTRRTLWLRRSVPAQLVRFGAINLRMMRIVRKGHGG